jgi:hypothetical protein
MSAAAFPVDVHIPKDSILDKIEQKYKNLDAKIQCGLCGAWHKTGCLVQFRRTTNSPPERAVMGHVCGHRVFGQVWTDMDSSFDIALRREDNQVELEKCLAAFPGVEEKLQTLLPDLKERHAIRATLVAYGGNFMDRCANAFKTGHSKGVARNHLGHSVSYQLDGEFFFQQDHAVLKAETILGRIASVRAAAQDAATRPGDMRKRLTLLKEALGRLKNLEWEAADGVDALNPENLKMALALFHHDTFYTGRTVRISGTVLEIRRHSGHKWSAYKDLTAYVPRLAA